MTKKSRIGLILLAVAIFGWFAVVRPQIDRFAERSLEAKVLSEELASYEQRIADVEEIKKRGEEVQAILRSLYLALPKSSQVPEVLVMIQAIANNSGVVLTAASVGTPSGEEVPVVIGFSGNVSTVATFLDALHNNVRTATVKSQNMTSDGSGNLTVSMSVGLVYQGGEL